MLEKKFKKCGFDIFHFQTRDPSTWVYSGA
jgi:hypothetical protein